MIELKKSELIDTLTTIIGVNANQVPVYGLLTEDLSLGIKRKLQKIHKLAHGEYVDYLNDKKEFEELKEEDKKRESELLDEEIVKLDCDHASLEMIESVNTRHNYNFEIIEKIAK